MRSAEIGWFRRGFAAIDVEATSAAAASLFSLQILKLMQASFWCQDLQQNVQLFSREKLHPRWGFWCHLIFGSTIVRRKSTWGDCSWCSFSRGSWCSRLSDAKIFTKISSYAAERSYIRLADLEILLVFDATSCKIYVKKINFVKKKIWKISFFLKSTFSIEGITDFPCFKNLPFQSQNRGSKVLQARNDDILQVSFQIWKMIISRVISRC